MSISEHIRTVAQGLSDELSADVRVARTFDRRRGLSAASVHDASEPYQLAYGDTFAVVLPN